MAERKRSNDGRSETQEIIGNQPDIRPDKAGRVGGEPAKQVATADEKKQTLKGEAGKTRVTKSLERTDDEEDS